MSTATGKDTLLNDKAEILDVIKSMVTARYDKDVHALAKPYSGHAAIFSLAPPLIHHGIDIAATQAWFDTWEGPIEIEPHDFKITVAGDTAFCHGYMRLAGNKKGVEHRVSFWMRETLCFAREENAWKIIHEHTSVPFYMDGSSRPAFDLQPE